MGKTLVELIPKLKPVQQEFICNCVQEYGNRPDMHRGLLPFLSVEDAVVYLYAKMAMMEMPENKFIRSILSILGEGLPPQKWLPDEEAILMELTTRKLWRFFSTRRDYIQFDARKYNLSRGTIPVQLERTNYNQWRVKTSRQYQNRVTTWLAEQFR